MCAESDDERGCRPRGAGIEPPLNRYQHMKTLLTLCLGTLVILARPDSARAADQDFTLINKTGVEIHALYVSPADKNDWGKDILGKDTLGDGQSAKITFHPKEEAAKWDLRVEDSKGNSIEWTDLDLTEISTLTLHYENGKATAEVDEEDD